MNSDELVTHQSPSCGAYFMSGAWSRYGVCMGRLVSMTGFLRRLHVGITTDGKVGANWK
jgi:hypothetical protein